MAIIRVGALVGAISGTVGGQTFVTGGRSTVVRNKPAARARTSPSLARERSRWAVGVNSWGGLTTGQQDAWRTAARNLLATNVLGESSPRGGFNFYMQLWMTFRRPSGDNNLLPPVDGQSAAPSNVSAVFDVGGPYNVDSDVPATTGIPSYQIWGYAFASDRENNNPPRLRFIATSNPISVPQDIQPAWDALFGPLQEGQRFAVGFSSFTSFAWRSEVNWIRGVTAP